MTANEIIRYFKRDRFSGVQSQVLTRPDRSLREDGVLVLIAEIERLRTREKSAKICPAIHPFSHCMDDECPHCQGGSIAYE